MTHVDYEQKENLLRGLILNACRQRHLSTQAASQQNQSWERHFAAAPLTLIDKGNVDGYKFSGTMEFFINGQSFMKITYAGYTQKEGLEDLNRFLKRGNIKQPFRGATRKLQAKEDKTIGANYKIWGRNTGNKSLFSPNGRAIEFEDMMTIRDGRTGSMVVHQAKFIGKVTADVETRANMVRFLQ